MKIILNKKSKNKKVQVNIKIKNTTIKIIKNIKE